MSSYPPAARAIPAETPDLVKKPPWTFHLSSVGYNIQDGFLTHKFGAPAGMAATVGG